MRINIRLVVIGILLSTFISTLMAGCGFHLRGTHNPKKIQVKELVLLPYEPYSSFYQLARENLKRAGIDVQIPQSNTNIDCPTLKLTKSEMNQHILVYSLQGQTRRERLQLNLKYDLNLPGVGKQFNQHMMSNRDRQLNPNQDLADQYEKNLLEKEMQQELIEQLIQQLSFLPLTEPYRCASISTSSHP